MCRISLTLPRGNAAWHHLMGVCSTAPETRQDEEKAAQRQRPFASGNKVVVVSVRLKT
jgi:hypothetical protein